MKVGERLVNPIWGGVSVLVLGLLGCDDVAVEDHAAHHIDVAGERLSGERLSGERLSKDPHWGDHTRPEVDPAAATSWLVESLVAGEVLEQVRFTELVESGHVLVEGVAQSADDARLIVFDDTGTAWTKQDLLQLEIEAHRARHGFLSHELHETIARAASEEPIDVIVYVDAGLADTVVPEEPPADLSFEEWHGAYREEKLARIAERTVPVEVMLLERGAKDVRVLDELAMIRAGLPADSLLDTALNQSLYVRGIELRGDERYVLRGYAAHGAMGEAVFDACGSYCEGSGQDVVVWESDADNAIAQLDFFPTYNTRFGDRSISQQLAPDECETAYDCDFVPGISSQMGYQCSGPLNEPKVCVGEHSTYVAGAIGMVGTYTQRGSTFNGAGAGGVAFHYANDGRIEGLDWALAIPSLFINRSQSADFSPVHAMHRAMDLAARYDFALITQASGNSGTANVDCKGWNTVCVGSYDYKVWNSRTDDRISLFTSYINPSSNAGLERPHLLGPGNHNASTSSGSSGSPLFLPDSRATPSNPNQMTDYFKGPDQGSNVFPVAGTSMAAPAILGLAVQFYLYEGPFQMAHSAMRKVVLMVGSLDANADGALPGNTKWNSATDAKDGAGAPEGARIKSILDNNRYRQLNLTNSSFVSCGSGCREYTVATVSVPANRTFRAGLADYSCAGTAPITNTLINDFDLVVSRQCLESGSLLSTSTNSEVELVQSFCELSTSNTIKVRIKNGAALQLCGSSTSEPVSVAWDYYSNGVIQ